MILSFTSAFLNSSAINLTLPISLFFALACTSLVSTAPDALSAFFISNSVDSYSSWHVFASIFLKDSGLPSFPANSGRMESSSAHRLAYMATNVGCTTAFSKTIMIVPSRTS